MDRILRYLSFRGRANRQRYWLTALSIWALFIVTALFAAVLSIVPLLGLVVVPVWLALIFAGIANGVRRLHDKGKSAWWLLLFYFLPMLLSVPAKLATYGPEDGFQLAAAGLALLGLPFSIWGLIVMGFLKGTPGPNAYGEDPLAPRIEEVFA